VVTWYRHLQAAEVMRHCHLQAAVGALPGERAHWRRLHGQIAPLLSAAVAPVAVPASCAHVAGPLPAFAAPHVSWRPLVHVRLFGAEAQLWQSWLAAVRLVSGLSAQHQNGAQRADR
jgi:hypothetical protein